MTQSSPGAPDDDELERLASRKADRIMAGLAVLTLTVGTVFYHFAETWSWIDSFYFSSVALSTVGFGDLTPTTDVSKLFTVAYIFSGVALISAFINRRLKLHGQRVKKRYVRASEAVGESPRDKQERGFVD